MLLLINSLSVYQLNTIIGMFNYEPLNDAPTLFTLYRKTISCVAFSSGGKYLAAGECGHQPCVRVWDVASQSILSELQGHTFGVACVVRQQRGMCVWVCYSCHW